ncbi:hypothetical protein ACFWGM_38360 [Streptomyces roseolus]|uniref:hypothetical protein n=1 Tax=Streptomyces roseolus TaxID=67358 RepID=UPI00362FBD2C
MSTGVPGSVSAAARGVVDGMGLVDRAGPAIEEQADQVAEAACELADIAAGSGWSAAAADDALVAIDTLTAALTQIAPAIGEALAAVTGATTTARRLGLPADPKDPTATVTGVPELAHKATR